MWWSYRSPFALVRAWHYLFDGTPWCRCERSRRWLAAIDANYAVTGPGE